MSVQSYFKPKDGLSDIQKGHCQHHSLPMQAATLANKAMEKAMWWNKRTIVNVVSLVSTEYMVLKLCFKMSNFKVSLWSYLKLAKILKPVF